MSTTCIEYFAHALDVILPLCCRPLRMLGDHVESHRAYADQVVFPEDQRPTHSPFQERVLAAASTPCTQPARSPCVPRYAAMPAEWFREPLAPPPMLLARQTQLDGRRDELPVHPRHSSSIETNATDRSAGAIANRHFKLPNCLKAGVDNKIHHTAASAFSASIWAAMYLARMPVCGTLGKCPVAISDLIRRQTKQRSCLACNLGSSGETDVSPSRTSHATKGIKGSTADQFAMQIVAS